MTCKLLKPASILRNPDYIYRTMMFGNAVATLAGIYVYSAHPIAKYFFATAGLMLAILSFLKGSSDLHRVLGLTSIGLTTVVHTLCNARNISVELMLLATLTGLFSFFQTQKGLWRYAFVCVPATAAYVIFLSETALSSITPSFDTRVLLSATCTGNILGFLLVLRADRNNMAFLMEEKKAILERQNREISDQHEKIKAVNGELTLIHYSLTSSITYAQRIQSSILPSKEQLKVHFADHFVQLKPRDGVSGDFYWLFHYNNRTYFAVADCTGHGVPGALMSMMGSSILNQIVQSTLSDSPKLILKYLDLQIIDMLSRGGKDMKEGMEMILAVVDHQNNKVRVSSANRPFLIWTGASLLEYKATKAFIGHSLTEKRPFEETTVELSDMDTFYFFTDGITDQFDCNNEKKYGLRRLKQFISDFASLELKEQEELFQKEMRAWMGNTPQTDDMLLVAIKAKSKPN
jgi:serine phosphatase RsbU (regulator of sigma subunit)